MTAEVYCIWCEWRLKIAKLLNGTKNQPEPCLEAPLCQKLPDNRLIAWVFNFAWASSVAQLKNGELLREICRISNIFPKRHGRLSKCRPPATAPTTEQQPWLWVALWNKFHRPKDMSTWYLRIWPSFEWHNLVFVTMSCECLQLCPCQCRTTVYDSSQLRKETAAPKEHSSSWNDTDVSKVGTSLET